MRSELKFVLFFIAIIVGTNLVIYQLLKKYATALVVHFFSNCSQGSNSLFDAPSHILGTVLFLLAFCVSLYLGLKLLASNLKMRRKKLEFISNQIAFPKKLVTVLAKTKLSAKDVLLVKSQKTEAFTVGFFSQKIVVTSQLLKRLRAKELEAVLLHEYYHLKRSHGIILLFGNIVSSIFFFLPFLKDILSYMRAEFEYQADDYAKQTQKTEKHVIQALVRLLASPTQTSFLPGFTTPIENRVAKLRGQRTHSSRFTFFRFGLSSIVLLLTFCLLLIPTTNHVQAETSLFLSLESCEQGKMCSTNCYSTDSLPQVSRFSEEMSSQAP